ncbi:MAG: radical SAM protein [Peptostreptococcaceae bacterium]
MGIKYVSVDLVICKECNMRCKYCCVPTSEYEFKIPSLEHIQSRIEKIEKQFKDYKINYILLGGELTLLDEDYLKNVIELILSRSQTGFLHLYTNMVKYSSVLDYYVRNFDKVYLRVSIDTINPLKDSRGIPYDLFYKNIEKYEPSKIVLDSTLDNITISEYIKLQRVFIDKGINKFKFKFERRLGQIIEYYGDVIKDRFVKYFVETQLHKDSVFITNYALNTTAIIMIDQYVSISLHNEEYNDRMNRNIFGKIQINNKVLGVYE